MAEILSKKILADLSAIPSWFVVLPDCESASSVDTALHAHAPQKISHPSGRPWILGRWDEGSVVTGQAGSAKVAVIGQHAITTGQLTQAAGRLRNLSDVDRLATSLVGSSHLVASVDRQVRLQGTIAGLRRVFYAGVGGTIVAADRADVLACLLDSALDEHRLALHLIDPLPFDLPLWQEVALLSTDHYLALDDDGRHRSVKWWSPPEPVVPMAEGALALREALADAVAARVQGRKLVSCDLGGLDSTSVCSLAARGEAKVVAYTAAHQDPLNDDEYWATRTIAGLGNIEHHIIPEDQMPSSYAGLLDMDDRLDQPCMAAADCERFLAISRRAAARGSQVHLTGFGGDEVSYGSLAHLHSLMRSKPRIAFRHVRGFIAKYGWSRRAAMRQLFDNLPYYKWLARAADDLTAPPLSQLEEDEPMLDWWCALRMPPWVTPAAVDAARELIRAEARTAEPLAKERGQHRELRGMRYVSLIASQLAQMAARFGITFDAPYYDDHVIEAALAVRPEERVTPWRYKPLILEAMRGIIPDESLTRQTKADGSADEETGLRQNRADLLALWEDSRLGRMGLVDADALHALCSRPLPSHLELLVLHPTVACEVWLRAHERVPIST